MPYACKEDRLAWQRRYQSQFRTSHPDYSSNWIKQSGFRHQKAWKSRNKNKVNSYTRLRQVLIKMTTAEFVDYDKVISDSSGLCGICLKPLDRTVEIDHIVPLSKGGTHTYSNVQASHSTCNRKKSAKLASNNNTIGATTEPGCDEVPHHEIGRR